MKERSFSPEPFFKKRLAKFVMPPLQGLYSGELVASEEMTIGAARFAGEVTGVWMSVRASGKDDLNELNVSGEVYISGTTCLTTTPMIAHISGEISQKKTTKVTGDTGIVQGVVDPTANTVEAGDVITAAFTVERTGSPTTEIDNPVIVVELEPKDTFGR
jgi:hypothetical protein